MPADSLENIAVDVPKRTRVTRAPYRNGSNSHYADPANTTFQKEALQHKFQLGTHMRAWLFQIMRNNFLTQYHRRERETANAETGVPDHDVPMFYDAPAYDSSTMEVHTDLERAMRRIPEDFGKALLLSEVEGMPLAEIASVMACPVGTVKSRVFRAKERLRGLLRDYDGEYDGHYRTPAKRAYNGTSINFFA